MKAHTLLSRKKFPETVPHSMVSGATCFNTSKKLTVTQGGNLLYYWNTILIPKTVSKKLNLKKRPRRGEMINDMNNDRISDKNVQNVFKCYDPFLIASCVPIENKFFEKKSYWLNFFYSSKIKVSEQLWRFCLFFSEKIDFSVSCCTFEDSVH